MPKRRSDAVRSDVSDDEPDTRETKRSRLVDATNRPPQSQSAGAGVKSTSQGQGGRAKSKGTSRADDDVEMEDEMGPQSDDEGDMLDGEDNEEEKVQRLIAKKMERQRNAQGRIGEIGIIETLQMTNFMCHKSLAFELGPQMNFIIGHNGSGKSAALSALTIALGGKTNSTGRGKGLAGFIKEGETQSTIIVGIKNQGDESYRREIYGDRIYVERKFSATTSTYKIMSSAMKVISTTRRELDAICDHMNIQVDNPLNVLTQDSARQFLSGGGAREKYRFFMEGTQLAQLSRTYEELEEKVENFKRRAEFRQEGVQEFKDKLDDAVARRASAAKVRNLEAEVERFKGLMAWAHVKFKRGLVTRIKDEVAKAQTKLEETTAAVTAAEQALPALTSDQTDELASITAKLRSFRSEQLQLKTDKTKANNDMKGQGKVMADLQRQIDAERAKLEASTQGVVARIQADIDAKKEQLAALADDLAAREAAAREMQTAAERVAVEGREFDAQRTRMQEDIARVDSGLSGARQASLNVMSQFGAGTTKVLAEIARRQWHGRVLGPLGQYVKVRPAARQYAQVLRNVLGHTLRAFALSDARDLIQLREVMFRNRYEARVVVSAVDIFDFAHNEPPAEALTVLRALEVTDDWTLRILINNNAIERSGLAPTRLAAQALGEQYHIRRTFSMDNFDVQVYDGGGSMTTAISLMPPSDGRNLLLQDSSDPQARIRQLEADLATAQTALRAHESSRPQQMAEFRQLHVKLTTAKREIGELRKRQTPLQSELTRLQEECAAAQPVSVSGFEERLQTANEERDSLKQQFADMMAREHEINEAVRPLLEKQKDLKAIESKLSEEQTKVDDGEKATKSLSQTVLKWADDARQFTGEDIDPYKDVPYYEVKIAALQHTVDLHNTEYGATAAELDLEVTQRQEAYDRECGDLQHMIGVAQDFERGITRRKRLWLQWRWYMAARCKVLFLFHLNNRGFYGKILFDHDNARLALRVKTDTSAQPESAGSSKKGAVVASKDKDPKSLSGGEKSFSTICLLLSLWESIGCPIRCLDEFDVFMDAVNRRVSMKMLIETAKAADAKQFVVITPLEMANVQFSESVKVHKMADPERGVTR
ncbi:P-loop containing nucleoside triphosphate hydrolase protein [Auriculariales sp. MPI-PUGE-AT-0066]|nr:P-loop containing nucleoside triphosphate hydrolase protein [Auriculariales sp. MPI-PUGE-AT-0066]